MSEISLVWRTDVHMAVDAPASRMDDWADTVLGKLEQVGEIAREVNASGVLDGGDFFHIKQPRRTTHELIQEVSVIHDAYPCHVYGNVGNHDSKYGDIRFLGESPLGVLFATGVFKRCYDAYEVTFMSPDHDVRVRVVGVPYHGTTYDMDRLRSIKKVGETHLVCMVHCLCSADGGTMFGGEDIFKHSDLVNLEPDVFLFGHWHKNQGVTEIAPGKHVVNVGSLTRGALNDDDMTRIPECVVLRLTPDGITIEQRPLDVRPSADVFDLQGRVRQEARSMTVDAFVDSVNSTLQKKNNKPLLDEVREMADLLEPVRERTIDYLEQAGAD